MMLFPRISYRDEWAEAIQMVAESLAKQEEEGILCSPTSQIENVNEEEMDTSISHYKRKVETNRDWFNSHFQLHTFIAGTLLE